MNTKYIILSLICALSAISSNSIFKHIFDNKISFPMGISQFLELLLNSSRNPFFWIGILVFLSGNLLWIFILSNNNMSIVFPFQIALVFILSTLSGFIFFNEQLKLQSTFGIVLIFIGILFFE